MMTLHRDLRRFINGRLTAAAEEIFLEFEKTIVQYEEVIDRQRRLLEITWKPQIKLHRIGLPQHHDSNREKLPTEQEKLSSLEQEKLSSLEQESQHDRNKDEAPSEQETSSLKLDPPQQHDCNKERVLPEQEGNSRLEQEPLQVKEELEELHTSRVEAAPLQIKEEQEELCTAYQAEHLIVKEEDDTLMVTLTYGESDSETEPISEQLLSHSPPAAESRDQEGSTNAASGSGADAEPKPTKRLAKSRSDSAERAPMSESQGNTDADLRPRHLSEDEEVLVNQERDSSLNQEEPAARRIKEEEEELSISQEGELLVLDEDGDTIMVTVTYGESDDSDPEPEREQLPSHSSPVAESRRQDRGNHVDSGSAVQAMYNNVDNGLIFSGPVYMQGFRNEPLMMQQDISDPDEKPYPCKICGKHFRKRFNLEIHMRAHTGEKPFSCNVCGKGFTRKDSVILHMRTHTGERPFICGFCGRRFGRKDNLASHMRIHTGERPHSCKICGKSFCQSNDLLRHTRTHAAEKPVPCDICGKRFRDASTMNFHKKRHK
ncbi:zinc finger protein with KRAB and SCAN domains 8-like [Astatotilapia calliptera]|uniref:C2H2-type domain-containing protein n=1 Tax=Astatotilapia calliptera TaxID=8154 RepID=A0AAX7TZ85_ASTCA|nr:zinc finger protein with KRAB and SCAN domains 8-like [Astatotilapia calliptera]